MPTKKELLADLVAAAEIAEMLGSLSRQRVSQIVASDGFPEPFADIAAGRIWRRADVTRWAKANGYPKERTE